jgi:hypothetical protein
MIVLFLFFLRTLHTIFHSDWTNLHSQKQSKGCYPPVSWWGYDTNTSLPEFIVVFLLIATLTLVRWNLNLVLICISMKTKDAEHFFA